MKWMLNKIIENIQLKEWRMFMDYYYFLNHRTLHCLQKPNYFNVLSGSSNTMLWSRSRDVRGRSMNVQLKPPHYICIGKWGRDFIMPVDGIKKICRNPWFFLNKSLFKLLWFLIAKLTSVFCLITLWTLLSFKLFLLFFSLAYSPADWSKSCLIS